MKIQTIIDAVCEATGVSPQNLRGENRRNENVRARWLVILIVHDATGRSWQQIGNAINRDHTTCIYGYRQADKRLENNDEFRAQYTATLAHLTALWVR